MTYQLGYHYIWNNETRSRIILSKLVKQTMGAMKWGTRGTCPLTFSDGRDIICYVPPTFFSLGLIFGEVAKIKMTFVMFHVRCTAKPSWCWNRVACGITDSDIFISFRFDKMIFRILQVSGGRERLLTASVRHFTLCGISDFYSYHWLYRTTVKREVIVLKQ